MSIWMPSRRSFLHALIVTTPLALAAAPNIASASDLISGDERALRRAKEQLLNYSKVEYASDGAKLQVRYSFKSEEQLNAAASYVSQFGLENFVERCEALTQNALSEERPSVSPFNTNPSILYRYVNSNGTHRLTGSVDGDTDFGKYGHVIFTADVGLTVRMSGGQFVAANSPAFGISYISSGGRLSTTGISLPTSCTPESASLSANFWIERTIEIGPLTNVVGRKAELVPLIVLKG